MPASKRKTSSIHPVSRTQAHARVKNLKCYPDMYDRLLEGWPLSEIAKFIREVKKESLDITESGLILALQEFRASLPPSVKIKQRLPKNFVQAAKAIEEGIDEVAELTKLYNIQMERVHIDFAHEKGIKKLMPTMGLEIRIAREILSNVADLKMSLGLSKRHLGQLDVEAKVLTDVAVRYEANAPNVKQVMANPQSRLKILGLVEKLLTKSTAKVVGDTEILPPPDALPVIDVEGEPVIDSEELFPEFGDDEGSEESK